MRPINSIYRRILPPSCISFSSPEGKKLFREALEQGTMESYFPLAEQFRTQDEPAYCGLATMVMLLNSLELDPFRTWKGVWRIYHEEMLDCCVDLERVRQEGITFDQFISLAKCNGSDVLSSYISKDPQSNLISPSTIDSFREIVHTASKYPAKTGLLAVSYSRKELEQTGEGHFSPLGGYHEASDKVLILDVARFKYPPHWVRVPDLVGAMSSIDVTTGKSRGFALLNRSDNHLFDHGRVNEYQGKIRIDELAELFQSIRKENDLEGITSSLLDSSQSAPLLHVPIEPSLCPFPSSLATESTIDSAHKRASSTYSTASASCVSPLALFKIKFPPQATACWMQDALKKELQSLMLEDKELLKFIKDESATDFYKDNILSSIFSKFITAVLHTPPFLSLVSSTAALQSLVLPLRLSVRPSQSDDESHSHELHRHGQFNRLTFFLRTSPYVPPNVRALIDPTKSLSAVSPSSPVPLSATTTTTSESTPITYPPLASPFDQERALKCLEELESAPFFFHMEKAWNHHEERDAWHNIIYGSHNQDDTSAANTIVPPPLSDSTMPPHKVISPLHVLAILFLSLPQEVLTIMDSSKKLSRFLWKETEKYEVLQTEIKTLRLIFEELYLYCNGVCPDGNGDDGGTPGDGSSGDIPGTGSEDPHHRFHRQDSGIKNPLITTQRPTICQHCGKRHASLLKKKSLEATLR